jgi:uncharacterized SAM-binding protein YcdF (DUF218 family)
MFETTESTGLAAAPAKPGGEAGPLARALELPPRVWLLLLGAYLTILGLLWLGFGTSTEGVIVLVVDTVFFAAFFTAPWVVMQIARATGQVEGGGFAEFLRRGLDTPSGQLTARDAMLQVALVPVALAFGIAAIALIAFLAR